MFTKIGTIVYLHLNNMLLQLMQPMQGLQIKKKSILLYKFKNLNKHFEGSVTPEKKATSGVKDEQNMSTIF